MRDANLRIPEDPIEPRTLFGWREVVMVIVLTVLGLVLVFALAAIEPPRFR
jgi:hypothetical protein